MEHEIRDMTELAAYARARASRSAERNDPLAWAYWRETAKWAAAHPRLLDGMGEEQLAQLARVLVACAVRCKEKQDLLRAALCYSRAKWVVAIARNRGYTMGRAMTGLGLDWIRDEEEPVDARAAGLDDGER